MRRNKSGDVQLPRCLGCRRKFSANTGSRYRRHPGEITTECLRLSFSGVSVRLLAENLEDRGITAGQGDHGRTCPLHRWIERYGPVADAYADR